MAAIRSVHKNSTTSISPSLKRAVSKSTSYSRDYQVLESSQKSQALIKKILDNAIFQESGTVSQKRILTVLHELQETKEGRQDKQFLHYLSEELKAISQVPYERHKLEPIEILKICLVANTKLNEAIDKSKMAYLRGRKNGISRAVVIDGKRSSFIILSKDYGELKAAGTFKKVTDAVEVSRGEQITARRVVCLRNKPNRSLSTKEISFQKQYGKILSWLRHRSKKEPSVKKTTIIEEAYDNDLYTFTSYMAPNQQKKLPFDELLIVLSEIGKTIAQMHQDGIVHQDLKVKNVLYKKNEDGTVAAKVIDFGHSYRALPSKSTPATSGHRYGTVRYSSPELLDISKQLPSLFEQRKAEDMYALGCLLYEVFYQKPLPWNEDVYAALKGKSSKEDHKSKGLYLQRTTAEALLKSSTALPSTEKRELEWICARLLDPNPKTRLEILEFQTALARLQKQASTKNPSNITNSA